ncbi:MAG: DUF58 domain-containing protein [Actinomycetia bacterium]|nr:DUF58 domain-containing protein [Actinomycetes bacterium]
MIPQATGRFTLGMATIAGCGLVAVLLGRSEIAALALPFVVAAGAALLTPEPDLAVSVGIDHDRIVMGDVTTLTVELRTAIAGWAEVTVLHPPPLVAGPTVGAVVIEAGRPAVVEFPFDTSAWGTVELGELAVVFRDRFGLRQWERRVPATIQLRIHPPPDELNDLIRLHLVSHRHGAHPSTQRAEGIEFAELRPFLPGDPLRSISWRASARSDQLWVTDRHPERSSDVVLFLDSYSQTGTDPGQALRWGIEASIMLARSHLSAGDRVGLVELGGLIRWVVPGLGAVQAQRLVDALLATRLVATEVGRDLRVLPLRALPPSAAVVALSPLAEDSFVDHLVDLRSRGHEVLVLDTWSDRHLPAPGSEGRHLAQRLWEKERELTRIQLGRLGIAVSTRRPDVPIDIALAELVALRRARTGVPR